MTERKPGGGRVIIGLRPLPRAEASIAAAIRLAAALEAEAVGMFVQEESLMSFAGLPFSGGLDNYGRPIDSVTPSSMLREFDRMETRWRRMLSEEAKKARVSSSFTCKRGEFVSILKSLLVPGDILVVSTSGSEYEARLLLDYIAAMPPDIRGVVVVPRSVVVQKNASVIALLDGDVQAQGILPLASRLAQLTGGSLEILMHAKTSDELSKRLPEIEKMLPHHINVNYQQVPRQSADSVAAMLHNIVSGFVVATLNDKLFQAVGSVSLICRAASSPIVLLRDGELDASSKSCS